MKLSDQLFDEGVFAQGIGFPTVPRGKARIRTIVTAAHTRDRIAVRARRIRHGRAAAGGAVRIRRWTLVAIALVVAASHGAAQGSQSDDEAIRALLGRLEQVVRAGDPAAYQSLLSDAAYKALAADFATVEFRPGATNVAIIERDRLDFQVGGLSRLVVDALVEYGDSARVLTWQIDVDGLGTGNVRIVDEQRLSSIEGLYRLSVNSSRQFRANNFRIASEDLELTLAGGSVFTIDTPQGITGLILLGRGQMVFHPAPDIEKAQVKIFSGSETLETGFDSAYVRFSDVAPHADMSSLVSTPVNQDDLRRASRIFLEESAKSYVVDLANLTSGRWSSVPPPGDLLAEVRTRRFETLTYLYSSSDPEEISVFKRALNLNISLYPSRATLEARGRFYSEDDGAGYDVLDYDVDMSYAPQNQEIDGVAKLRVRILSPQARLTLALADSLAVQSITSEQFGRLLPLRVTGRSRVILNLPATLLPGADDTLTIAYRGRLAPQPPEQETVSSGQAPQSGLPPDGSVDVDFPAAEPSFLYSSASAWYPQAPITDYATATLNISVPSSYSCVASGSPTADSPARIAGDGRPQSGKRYTFVAARPLRYLSFVVSRFNELNTNTGVKIYVNPRLTSSGRETAAQASDIAAFYESVLGDKPYPSLALTLVESNLPGGHSPAYFAVMDIPMPGGSLSWRNDPVAFQEFPEFFLAHELAHQWWGQAVGWGNYHEQWLSEGFAQYFAALYAQRRRGDAAFASVLRTMRQWSIERSAAGPVYLGYRVGHVRSDSRSFRAIVYDKGAIALHMLRQLLGDDVFFSGLRQYYATWRFRKAGTEDFRKVMEEASGQKLDRFFERWIYGSSLPRLTFSYRVEPTAAGQELVLHFDQVGELFDVPVGITVQYANRTSADVVVPVTERSVEKRVPLNSALRSVDISKNDISLAVISKN